MKTALLLLTLAAVGCGPPPCPEHSHEYQDPAGGPQECQADPCWAPNGQWAGDGFSTDPTFHCFDAGGAEASP